MLLLFRATTCYSTLSERTTGNRDGLLVIVAFDSSFEKDEAANVADAITNVSSNKYNLSAPHTHSFTFLSICHVASISAEIRT